MDNEEEFEVHDFEPTFGDWKECNICGERRSRGNHN